MRVLFGVAASLLVFAAVYGLKAFISWDAYWLSDVGSWKEIERFLLIYVTVLVCVPAGCLAGSVYPSFIKAMKSER